MPGFWIGLLLILLFAVELRWLPAFGSPTPSGIVLPAIVLAVANVAVLTRLSRSSVLLEIRAHVVTHRLLGSEECLEHLASRLGERRVVDSPLEHGAKARSLGLVK